MPHIVTRLRVVEERVRVAASPAEDIFRDAFGILRQALRDSLALPDKSTVRARIDWVTGASHYWNAPLIQKPWHSLRAEIVARLEPLERQEENRPADQRNTNRELLRWRAAFLAVEAFLANTMCLAEESLNKARAWWSLHDKQPTRRGKKNGRVRHLQKENVRLRAELAQVQKRRGKR